MILWHTRWLKNEQILFFEDRAPWQKTIKNVNSIFTEKVMSLRVNMKFTNQLRSNILKNQSEIQNAKKTRMNTVMFGYY